MDDMQQKALEEYTKQMQQLSENIGTEGSPFAGMMTAEQLEQFGQVMQQASDDAMAAYANGIDANELMAQYGVEFDEEDYTQFVAEHPVAPGMENYMAVGALLIGTNDEPYETLALSGDKEDFVEALEEAWGIENREEALEMLDSLLAGRHTAVLQPEFDIINLHGIENYFEAAGEDSCLDEDDLENLDAAYEAIEDILEIPAAAAKKVKSVSAWDIDRVGLLARMLSHVGYITVDEAYDYLKKAGAQAKEHFTSWEEYIISVILGRSLHLGLSQYVFACALDLLTDSKSFLDARPITSL